MRRYRPKRARMKTPNTAVTIPSRRPDGSAGRTAVREPTGGRAREETHDRQGAPLCRPCAFRHRRDKRICPCKTAAAADPCRTIHTGAAKNRRPTHHKTNRPASRVRRSAEPRGRVLAGERERFRDGPQSSDTAASLPDSVADTHFCDSIRIQHGNDRQPPWPATRTSHTARRSTDELKMETLAVSLGNWSRALSICEIILGVGHEGIHFQASGTYSRCAVLLRSDAVSWLLANHEWLADGAILQQLQDSIPGTERVSPSARRTGKATRH